MLESHPRNPLWPLVAPVPGATSALIKAGTSAALSAGFYPAGAPNTFQAVPWPAMVGIGVVIDDVAASLCLASHSGLSAQACYALCTDLLVEGTGWIRGKPKLARLPPYLRRAVSEVLSNGMSLAWMLTTPGAAGASFIASKDDFNKVWGPLWGSLWTGDGPDYLCCNDAGGYSFLEVKGHSGKFMTTPRQFLSGKLQSLNAVVGGLGAGPVANILCYANLPAGKRCSIQWINHRVEPGREEEEEEPEPEWRLVLRVALVQFVRQLINAGYMPLARAFSRRTAAARRAVLVGEHFEAYGPGTQAAGWRERSGDAVRLAVPQGAFDLFAEIADHRWEDDAELGRQLLERLLALRGAPDGAAEGFLPLARSATGVQLISLA